MSNLRTKQIRIDAGERITIDSPREVKSRYSIEAPSAWYGWDYAKEVVRSSGVPSLPNKNVVMLCNTSPLRLRQAAEKIALYFQRQFGYDFQQYEAERPVGLIFLWSVGTEDDRRAIGAVHFVEVMSTEKSYWKLNWAWFHPYVRRRGLLREMWPYFRARFGRFQVEPPISAEMEQFLTSMNCSDWCNTPSVEAISGDWSKYSRVFNEGKVPELYSLQRYYPSESNDGPSEFRDSTDFYDFLISQIDRDDPVGDIAKLAYSDKEWPSVGGIIEIWNYLIRTGFFIHGFSSLRDAWEEYWGEIPNLDIANHRQVANKLYQIEDLLRETSDILSTIAGPGASSLRKMERISQLVRSELKELLTGEDREIYISKPTAG